MIDYLTHKICLFKDYSSEKESADSCVSPRGQRDNVRA